MKNDFFIDPHFENLYMICPKIQIKYARFVKPELAKKGFSDVFPIAQNQCDVIQHRNNHDRSHQSES